MTPEELAEVDRLRRWKAEAIPVIMGLQDLGRALDLRLGENITGPAALAAVNRLRDQVAAVEKLHWPDSAPLNTGSLGYFCDHCSRIAQDYVEWPCATKKALS